MQRHWRALVGLFGLLLLGFVGGLGFGSIAFALASLVSGLVIAFVMAVAYLRPAGASPEHHARVDHMLDDTNP